MPKAAAKSSTAHAFANTLTEFSTAGGRSGRYY